VFFVALSTLFFEVLLTRIFSVTMWYHFAFMAVSLAMFGMTLGALTVYLLPHVFSSRGLMLQLGISSFAYALSVVICFLAHIAVPFEAAFSLRGFLSVAYVYVVIGIPFVFSGICVSLVLTRFPGQVGGLYAADLFGAALGCLILVWVLGVTDGPTAVFVAALLGACGALCFLVAARSRAFLVGVAVSCVFLAGFVAFNTWQVHRQRPLIRLRWVKGRVESLPTYEAWNCFSRVTVWGDADRAVPRSAWGLSPAYKREHVGPELYLTIDGAAGTCMEGFDGDFEKVAYLKQDIVNLAHYLRPAASVLIVGTGGNRDVLSALAFGQASITGVEINGAIFDIVNGLYGDFGGQLALYPGVRFVNDEARSYIARQGDLLDILQITFVDTWAATAAGAFVLTENSLYTVEAWRTFLSHLTPTGILTVSRWWFSEQPAEMYRLTALACAALRSLGVTEPADHILLVRLDRKREDRDNPVDIGCMLVGRSPFTQTDLMTIERLTNEMQFELSFSPKATQDERFRQIAEADDLRAYARQYPLDISPPTDDRPFFFHMLRFRDMARPQLWELGNASFNLKAVFVLGSLLVIVGVLTLLCIFVPLLLSRSARISRRVTPYLVYFAAIGLGFMLIEIGQVQHLMIFLGHPTYGLTVALFTLLVAGGAGSWIVQHAKLTRPARSMVGRLAVLLLVLLIMMLATPIITSSFQSSETPVRIVVAVLILAPMGLVMGTAFPLGMRWASSSAADLTPWLWGINGATSVCASVLAVVISLAFGISVTLRVGFAAYVVATLTVVLARRRTFRAESK
jgi:hypothetical protein